MHAKLSGCSGQRDCLRQKYVILHYGFFTVYIFFASNSVCCLKNANYIYFYRQEGEQGLLGTGLRGLRCLWTFSHLHYNVKMTSMRRPYVASTSVRRRYDIVCLLGEWLATCSAGLSGFYPDSTPVCNLSCYLEGAVIGRYTFRVSMDFVSYVSVVRPYLWACTVVYDYKLILFYGKYCNGCNEISALTKSVSFVYFA